MTESSARRPWILAAAAVAVVLIVAVIVALAGGGGDDDGTAATTAGVSPTSGPASSAPSSTPSGATSAPGATSPATTSAPDQSTAPSTAGDAPATSAPGAEGTAAPTTAPATGSLVTVPTGTVPVADPIPQDEVGDFGTGVTAEIVTIEAVEGEAKLPGEISGPALRVRVRLVNGTDDTLNLSRVLVDVTYGPDRTPGLALGEPGAEPFIGELAAGASGDGVYVFGVPVDERDQVQINVSYDVTAPILVFEGPAPR